MRIHTLAALIVMSFSVPVAGQQQKEQTTDRACQDQGSAQLTDSYYDAVVSRIRPPGWQNSLIRITLGVEKKLVLLTDGNNFELATETPQTTVHEFLTGLAESCRLPRDPKQAFELVKINWETSRLESAQFEQLHRDFTAALLQYVAKIQERYSGLITTRMSVVHLDSEGYSITYENSYERVALEAWNMNEEHPTSSMISWVHQLQRLAEEKFHRPFGPK